MHPELRLHDFRAFRDSGWFTVRDLSYLVGRNSTGKSSVISALLLLKQSLLTRGVRWETPGLALRGPLHDAGTFQDLLHRGSSSEELGFEFRVRTDELRTEQLQFRKRIMSTFRGGQGRAIQQHLLGSVPAADAVPDGNSSIGLYYRDEEPFGPVLTRLELDIDNLGSARFTRTSGEVREDHWRSYCSGIPAQSIKLVTKSRLLAPSIERRPATYAKVGPLKKRSINLFCSISHMLYMAFEQYLRGIVSTGPFRTPPERRYSFAGFRSGELSPSGAEVADVLIAEKLLGERSRTSISGNLSKWLARMGLAKSLSVDELSRRASLFEIVLSGVGPASSANLRDVGFGVSQVLPVLSQALLAPKGGTFIVQQPELHLHPDAQASLTDIFIKLLEDFGVKSLIETHSEYVLLRLRRRVAERATKRRPKNLELGERVGVLLTEPDGKRASIVRQMNIGSDFQLANMPPGFMSQALDDRMAILDAVARAGRQ